MDAYWIAVAFGAPILAGLVVAGLVRLMTDDSMIASVIGAMAVFVVVLLLFAREFIEVRKMHEACRAAGKYCPVFPNDFNRYAIVGGIGFVDVGIVFLAGLKLDERRRRRLGS